MSRVEKGKAGLSEDALHRIAGALQISAHKLFEPSSSNVELVAVPGKPLPVLDYVQAGQWTTVKQTLEDLDVQETLLADLDTPPSSFFLRIRGNSMEPVFREGDVVLIVPSLAPSPGDYVVATDENGDATFKKYREIGTGVNGRTIFELVALNPDYGAIRSDQQSIVLVGTMIEHRHYRRTRR